jgi:hypothetical protein
MSCHSASGRSLSAKVVMSRDHRITSQPIASLEVRMSPNLGVGAAVVTGYDAGVLRAVPPRTHR